MRDRMLGFGATGRDLVGYGRSVLRLISIGVSSTRHSTGQPTPNYSTRRELLGVVMAQTTAP